MYLYFSILGFIFTIGFCTITYFIYAFYPINKLTLFINPVNKSVWNNITPTVIPTLLWSLIEMPILGQNKMYMLALILKIFISMGIIYIIKYTAIAFQKENVLIDLISMYIAIIVSSILSFLMIKLNSTTNYSILVSIIGTIILCEIFLLLKLKTPNYEFFKGKEK